MKLIIHLNNSAEDNLLDLGCKYTAVKDGDDDHLVVTLPLEDDDELLLESLNNDELVEFFGIDSENLIYTEVA